MLRTNETNIVISLKILNISLCLYQVVSQYSGVLSPICVDAVLRVIDPSKDTNVDLHDIKLIQKLGLAD